MDWVLIDASWLAYRVRYGHSKTWNMMDDPIGFIYGYLDQLRAICHDERIQSSKIVMFEDSIESKRKEIYPQYKENRHPVDNDDFEELVMMKSLLGKLLTKILPKMGIPVYKQAGYEADDLIASAAAELSRVGRGGVIVTADQDLYQCITSNIAWYNPTKKLYHTPSTFMSEYGIDPRHWTHVKAISGCSSDNIEGIKGVGEKTALKHILETLPSHTKAYQKIKSAEGMKIFSRNYDLVALPFEGTQRIELNLSSHSMSEFRDICEHYEFDSFLKGRRLLEWRMILEANGMKNPLMQRTRKRGES